MQLAWGFDQSSFLIHEAQPDMAALAVASGETIGLLVAVKDQAVCLDMVESQHPLRCSFTKGRGLPLARGASAKSLLAFMPVARLQAALGYLAGEAGMDQPSGRLRRHRQRSRCRRLGRERADLPARPPGRRLDHADGAVDPRGAAPAGPDRHDGRRPAHFAEAAGALSARPDTVTFRIPSRPTLIFHSMLSRRSTAFPVPPAASRLAFRYPFLGLIMTTRRTLLTAALSLGLAAWTAGSAHAQETIRAVTDATFPPMEFVKDGKRTGFDIELVEALAGAMGKKVEWIDIDFKGLIPALQAGRADIAVSAIYITPERSRVVDFTDPYYAGGLVVLTKKDGPIKTLKDMDGRKVSVQVGTKSVNYLKEHFPSVQRVEVEKNQEMFSLVQIGRAEAAVTGKPAAKLFAQSTPDLTVLTEQVTTEEYGIAVPKNKPELTRDLNAALAKLKADGSYQAIVNKWFEAPAK